ncbi:ProQ/FINO family protein [Thiolinea disciformis]|uniref:ProQ/FINO family protein n=1 Tax=Thiolinea disciformis TaxID=125614 RepID=UPI00037E6F49|nr:ProQ/FINO family protein [Thiolinea disciformis]
MADTPKKTLTLKRPGVAVGASVTASSLKGKRIIKREPQQAAKPHKPSTAKKKPARKPTKKPTTPPSDLKAQALNERLNAFPVWANFQPLAIGIDKAIYQLVNAEHFAGASKKVVQKVLRMHTRHGRYLAALQAGGARYNLDGCEAMDTITPHQVDLAGQWLQKPSGSKH